LKENFTDSIFKNHKEKEMADFRKWFIVLAMLSLFAGMAAAQTGTSAFVCSTVAQVTPTLRSEGITELVGDIVLTCTGGNAVATGQPIPQANVIVSLTAPVTSRLQTGAATVTTGASEALLLIDEPGAPIPPLVNNFGPAAPISVCPSITGGCVEYAAEGALINPLSGSSTIAVAVNTPSGTTAGYNAFQGVVAGSNQVIFPGVPILPPATTGVSRVYRITNIRVNASGAGSSLISGIQPVYAYLSTSGPTALPVGNQALTVGFVQTSLTTKATATQSTVLTQCNGQTGVSVATLSFSENFPSAFKTRVAPLTTDSGASYLATNATGQNIPGQLYNTESGFIQAVGTGGFVAGLADFGTRFKASFTNLPAGVQVYVSQHNIPVTGQTGDAIYTSSETGAFNSPTTNTAIFGTAPNTVQVVRVIDTGTTANASATAVWEVVNANLAQSETFNFNVYVSYTPGGTSAAPTPTIGTNGSVTLSYAPISAVTAAAAAGVAPIPRFVVGSSSSAQSLINVVACQTILLFPYVTTMAGLDTGIAIANTGLDPLTPATVGSTGSCKLYFYGSNLSSTAIVPPTTVPTIGPIAPGNPDYTKGAFLASAQFGSNVTGYMFAACDFQFAHGFAFISDAGLRNLAMGYLALVVNDGLPLTRGGAQKAESLGN
jgi:hypothetical protein